MRFPIRTLVNAVCLVCMVAVAIAPTILYMLACGSAWLLGKLVLPLIDTIDETLSDLGWFDMNNKDKEEE